MMVPSSFQTFDEMDNEEFNLMMENGLSDAEKGNSRLAKSVFDDLRQEIIELDEEYKKIRT